MGSSIACAAQHLAQALGVVGHVAIDELVAALVHDCHLSSTTVDVQTYVEHVMTSFGVRDYQGPSNAGRRPDPHIVRNVIMARPVSAAGVGHWVATLGTEDRSDNRR